MSIVFSAMMTLASFEASFCICNGFSIIVIVYYCDVLRTCSCGKYFPVIVWHIHFDASIIIAAVFVVLLCSHRHRFPITSFEGAG